MYDIIVKIYWGVYFVQKADLDPLIFVPARECAKAHSFLLPKIRGVKITCVIWGNPVKYGQKIT